MVNKRAIDKILYKLESFFFDARERQFLEAIRNRSSDVRVSKDGSIYVENKHKQGNPIAH